MSSPTTKTRPEKKKIASTRPSTRYAYKPLFRVRSPPPHLQLLLPVLGCSCLSGKKIADLEQAIQAFQSKARQKEDDLNETISSLRAQNSKLSAFIVTLAKLFLTILRLSMLIR